MILIFIKPEQKLYTNAGGYLEKYLEGYKLDSGR